MKQLKFIVSSLIVMLAASSCKKESTPAPVVLTTPKISKIDVVGSTWSTSYSYNAQGRLAEVKDNSFTSKYEYATGTPVITTYYTATGIKSNILSEMVLNSSNRALQFKYTWFDALGQPNGSYPINYEYEANGFQVKKSYPGFDYITELTNGNMTKLSIRNSTTGAVERTLTFEFYADKLDKLNLNIFEAWYDNIIIDKSLTGTKNTNLFKKITYQSATRTEVTDFTYVTNADGLLTEYTTNWSLNGAVPTPTTYKIAYQ